MYRGLVLLLALPLLGCMADQQQQLAKCISEAEQEYNEGTWVLDDTRQKYVWLCMAANGYRLNRLQNACSADLPATEAMLYGQCYQPIGKTSAWLQRLEATFSHPAKKSKAQINRPRRRRKGPDAFEIGVRPRVVSEPGGSVRGARAVPARSVRWSNLASRHPTSCSSCARRGRRLRRRHCDAPGVPTRSRCCHPG